MSDELKACPFCGTDTALEVSNYTEVICTKCFNVPNIKGWNTRPLEDALRSRVEELERERKQNADNLSDPDDIVVIANNLRTMRLLSDNANLQAELARLREMANRTCEWVYMDGDDEVFPCGWHGDCGNFYWGSSDMDNGEVTYCPGCGGKVVFPIPPEVEWMSVEPIVIAVLFTMFIMYLLFEIFD